MLKSIPFFAFARLLFDSKAVARKAAVILKAILEAQSPRLSEIARKMPGTPAANYKQLQRFLAHADPHTALRRLFQTAAPFVLGDPTEIPCPQAYRTPYVGVLVVLSLTPGETVIHRQLRYKGRVRVNVIGVWRPGFSEPPCRSRRACPVNPACGKGEA